MPAPKTRGLNEERLAKSGRAPSGTPRSRSFRPVIAQLVMTAAFALVALPFDVVVAYSVLLGGLCCVIPGAFSAYRMSVPTVRVSEAATHVWMAQGGKLALTVLMLIVVFSSVEPLAAVFFFGTMLVVQTAYALEPMLTRAATQRMTDRLIQE